MPRVLCTRYLHWCIVRPAELLANADSSATAKPRARANGLAAKNFAALILMLAWTAK
jgi:hypothetical protein